MTSSQTGSKLADSLRRAKTQQDSEESLSDAMPAPKTSAPAASRGRRSAASKPSFVMSSRCWPD